MRDEQLRAPVGGGADDVRRREHGYGDLGGVAVGGAVFDGVAGAAFGGEAAGVRFQTVQKGGDFHATILAGPPTAWKYKKVYTTSFTKETGANL